MKKKVYEVSVIGNFHSIAIPGGRNKIPLVDAELRGTFISPHVRIFHHNVVTAT